LVGRARARESPKGRREERERAATLARSRSDVRLASGAHGERQQKGLLHGAAAAVVVVVARVKDAGVVRSRGALFRRARRRRRRRAASGERRLSRWPWSARAKSPLAARRLRTRLSPWRNEWVRAFRVPGGPWFGGSTARALGRFRFGSREQRGEPQARPRRLPLGAQRHSPARRSKGGTVRCGLALPSLPHTHTHTQALVHTRTHARKHTSASSERASKRVLHGAQREKPFPTPSRKTHKTHALGRNGDWHEHQLALHQRDGEHGYACAYRSRRGRRERGDAGGRAAPGTSRRSY